MFISVTSSTFRITDAVDVLLKFVNKKATNRNITDSTKKHMKRWQMDLRRVKRAPQPKRLRKKIDFSTGFEEEDSDLAQVEIDKMLRFVRHIAAKVAANDTMPRRVVFLVELEEKNCQVKTQKKN